MNYPCGPHWGDHDWRTEAVSGEKWRGDVVTVCARCGLVDLVATRGDRRLVRLWLAGYRWWLVVLTARRRT